VRSVDRAAHGPALARRTRPWHAAQEQEERDMDFRERVFVVTGSGTGAGAATAVALASQGARVVVNYSKSADDAQAVAERCKQAGGEAIVVQGDVSAVPDCTSIAKAAVDRWGGIDGLVNNAGITTFVSHANLDGLDANDFLDITRVNVIGTFQMVRACAPALRERRGAIVNVSSSSALDGMGSSIAYAASKGAVNTMTLSLARALGPEIRVNAVCPGFIETRWLKRGYGDEVYERVRASYRANSALGETLTPEDVAESILTLLWTPKLTGQILRLDAGRWLGAPPKR
jgi:3-oxoacyl-[acyl-carrier protein] reductase